MSNTKTYTPKKERKVIGASKTEVVIELANLKSACVFYADLLKPIIDTAEQKKINIYVYRRDRGERFSKNRIYYGIYAVPCGQPKTSKASYLTNVICSVGAYPHEVCPHSASKQYCLLKKFLAEMTTYQPVPAKIKQKDLKH